MCPALRVFLCAVFLFLACAWSAEAAIVNASWNSATDVPVTASSYTATGGMADFTLDYAPVAGTNLMVVNNTGPEFINGTFSNLSQGQTVTLSYNGVNYKFVANYYGGTGNDLVLVWASNRVLAWGYNNLGQIGDSTSSNNRLVPAAVTASGVLAGKTIIALAAGSFHSLALCSDGTLAAWGNNTDGQLGDNTTTQRNAPVAVNTSSGVSALYGKTVVAIAAGNNTSLALCSDGTVAAWGLNTYGGLGDNSTISRSVPVAVNTTSGVSALYGKVVTSIAAGWFHNLVVCSDGTVVAWGYNTSGQLGINNTTAIQSVPVLVNTASGTSALFGKTVVAVGAGYAHSLALCSDGTVAAWGRNTEGQLGDTTTTQRLVPVTVNTASGTSALYGKTVVAMGAGYSHSMALCSDGTVAAWGFNFYGQLGNNSNTDRKVPVAVNTTSGVSALYGKVVIAIVAGSIHNLALCADGTLVAWGSNLSGQVGNNSSSSKSVPVLVNTASGTSALFGKTVVTVGAGDGHSLAICSDGTLAAWGDNTYGQLGDTTTTQRRVPVAVNTASGVSALYGKTVVAMVGGYSDSLALCSDGTLAAWGYNAYGQLGDNTTTQRNAPVLVNATSNLSALYGKTVQGITFGFSHSAALCTDGTIATWGDNSPGTLGNNSTISSSLPVSVSTSMLVPGEKFVKACSASSSVHMLGLVAAPPAAPAVATLAASSVSATGAALNGTANANNSTTTVSFEYGLTTAYVSTVAATPSTLMDSNSTAESTTVSGLTPATLYHYRIKAVSGAGTSYGADAAFTTLSLQQNWRQQNFGTSASSGLTADTADYDGDGICNLMEYALNLDPKASGKLPVATAMNGANLEYTYTRSTAAANAGATFTVEWNSTLSAASWSSSGVTQTVLSDDGTTQQVKAVIPMNAASKMFVHLSVTAPP